MCGISTWEEHTGERKWEVLGWRGLSVAIFALAVPAWHRTVHRTVNYHNYGKFQSSKFVIYAVIYKITVCYTAYVQ